jgi:hypothetical protein
MIFVYLIQAGTAAHGRIPTHEAYFFGDSRTALKITIFSLIHLNAEENETKAVSK